MEDLPGWFQAIAAFLSGLVVWGLASGRWLQKRDDDHAAVLRLEQAVRDEDNARRALIEKVNTELGRLESRVVWHNERDDMMFKQAEEQRNFLIQRIERLEEDVRDLQRQIDKGLKERDMYRSSRERGGQS